MYSQFLQVLSLFPSVKQPGASVTHHSPNSCGLIGIERIESASAAPQILQWIDSLPSSVHVASSSVVYSAIHT